MEYQKRDSATLRQKAEVRLKSRMSKTPSRPSESDLLKSIHELEVHQIELEIQNEELELAKSEAQDAVDLYDYAPTGYFTLSQKGAIIGMNHCGAKMLGKERGRLRNQLFGAFVSSDTKLHFYQFLDKIFKGKTTETCDISLLANGNSPVYLHLSGIVAGNREQCLVTAVDITKRKITEEALLSTLSLTEATLNSVHNGILAVGINGNVIKTNSKFAELWHIPDHILASGNDKILMDHILDKLADPNEFIAKVEELYKNQDASSTDLIHFKDGRTFERISRPMFMGDKPNGRVWSFLDITENEIAAEKERRYATGLAVLAGAAAKFISMSPDENIYNYIKDVLQTITGAKYVIINSYDKTSNALKSESFFADVSTNKQIRKMLGRSVEGFTMNPDDQVIKELLRKEFLLVSGGLFELAGGKIPRIICRSIERLLDIGKVYSMGLCVGNELYGTATLLLGNGDLIEDTGIINTFIDQTSAALQRISVDEALKESEKKLLEAQHLAHIGSWQWNSSTDLVKWSDELFQITGLDRNFPAPKFAAMSSCHTHESWELLTSEVTKTLRTGKPYSLDLEMVRPNGELVKTHSKGKADYDAKGKLTGISGTIQDITERKKAEDALKSSESRAQALISAIPDMMFMLSSDGVYLDFKSARENLAYQSQSIIGKNNRDVTPPEFANLIDEKIKLTLQTGQMQEFEYQLPVPQKGICDFDARMVASGNDKVIAIVRDITERKRTDLDLMQTKEWLSLAMDQSHLAYWEMDAATNTFTFNDQFYELYATTAKREGGYLMPSTAYAQNFLLPEESHIIAKDIALLLSGKIDKLEKEHRICRRDGEIRYIVVRINVVRDTNGLITGTRGSNQDITEMTLAKEALKKSEAELRELNATKDKFFSIIAHDLKSPFNAIMGFSDILVEQVREKDYEGIDEYAGYILQSSKRAMDLLMNLMEWTRSQTGRIDFHPEHFEMIQFLGNVIPLFDDIAGQKSISIAREFPPEAIVFADQAMISTVFRNLISNAIKFTRPGGTITLRIKNEESGVLVSVQDTGIGIPENMISRLFRIDQSYSTTGTNNEQGTGLGLILCKEFVEKHVGTIWVESEVGKGSAFYFTLPD